MRLVWVVPGPIDQLTGGYLYDARIVRGLGERGHAVRVATLDQCFWPLDPIGAKRLIRALDNEPWDVAVVDELAHPAMALALPIARRRAGHGPIVGVVHHLRSSEPAAWPLRSLAAVVERAALSRVDGVICTSRTTAAAVRGLLRRGVSIQAVEPGWDTHNLDQSRDRERAGPRRPAAGGPLAHARGSDGEDVRILMVAHWTTRKGVLHALQALALAHPAITLDLVGDRDRDPAYAGQVRAMLSRRDLAGRVRVHGRVSSERLADLYAAADGLVLASTHEGYGMVLAEGLAAGLPIVATRVGAVPEVVRDGLEAELVPPGHPTALARALGRLADPAERRRRRAHALERASTLTRWEDACAAFEKALLGMEKSRSGIGPAMLGRRTPSDGQL